MTEKVGNEIVSVRGTEVDQETLIGSATRNGGSGTCAGRTWNDGRVATLTWIGDVTTHRLTRVTGNKRERDGTDDRRPTTREGRAR